MDKLTEFYSNPTNIAKLGNFLKTIIRKNGLFHDEDDAWMTIEDVIQDTFLDLNRSKKEYNNCKFITLIYRVAKNNAFSELKKRKMWKGIAIEFYDDENMIDNSQIVYDEVSVKFHLPENLNPQEYAERNELREILEKEINNLSNTYAGVFLLYHVKAYSHPKIASMLNIPINTSKSRAYKARKKLKKSNSLRNYLIH